MEDYCLIKGCPNKRENASAYCEYHFFKEDREGLEMKTLVK
jgi:hypothetical protein